MKVIVKLRNGDDHNDWRDGYNLEAVDDQGSRVSLDFYDGEPEDANLRRDFNDVYSIPDIIRLAHQAGVNGELLSIEQLEVKEEE